MPFDDVLMYSEKDMTNYPNSIRTFDLGDVESSLRGFANTIRGEIVWISVLKA